MLLSYEEKRTFPIYKKNSIAPLFKKHIVLGGGNQNLPSHRYVRHWITYVDDFGALCDPLDHGQVHHQPTEQKIISTLTIIHFFFLIEVKIQ